MLHGVKSTVETAPSRKKSDRRVSLMTKKDNCKTSREADFMSGPAPEEKQAFGRFLETKRDPSLFMGFTGNTEARPATAS